jgi:hypothetical protein
MKLDFDLVPDHELPWQLMAAMTNSCRYFKVAAVAKNASENHTGTSWSDQLMDRHRVP